MSDPNKAQRKAVIPQEQSPVAPANITPPAPPAGMPPDLPPEVRQYFVQFMASIGQTQNPLFGKVNEDHITQILNIAANDSIRDHENQKIHRMFIGGLLCLILVFVFALAWLCFAYAQSDKMMAIVAAVASLLGGIGIKSMIDRK